MHAAHGCTGIIRLQGGSTPVGSGCPRSCRCMQHRPGLRDRTPAWLLHADKKRGDVRKQVKHAGKCAASPGGRLPLAIHIKLVGALSGLDLVHKITHVSAACRTGVVTAERRVLTVVAAQSCGFIMNGFDTRSQDPQRIGSRHAAFGLVSNAQLHNLLQFAEQKHWRQDAAIGVQVSYLKSGASAASQPG